MPKINLNGFFYLDNAGAKGNYFVNGKVQKVLLYDGKSGYCKMRAPLYQYSIGNFSGYAFLIC